MPHVSSSGGDDLGSTDEVKVFKDEGDGEDEKRSSENLTEEKSSLIDLTESEEKSGGNYTNSHKHAQRPDHSPVFGKVEPSAHTSSFNMGYLVGPYGYANGATGPIPVSMCNLCRRESYPFSSRERRGSFISRKNQQKEEEVSVAGVATGGREILIGIFSST
ncbi:unnamed protein product [Brassicogethes aeneus]|uniref:CTNNB1 binding N-teminal domain-containing protein n=1 Tax=Brassicogethes aeneus TaxID=1431903 RepID=A0A9P0AQM0_BRAAE|nr:unnamed protein product [Brassicogethes aeneus]